MKLKIKYIALAVSSLMAMTSCEEDATLITPDTSSNLLSTDDGNSDSKAILSSERTPDCEVVFFNIGDPENTDLAEDDLGRSDNVKVILPKALDHDLHLRIGMEPDYANGVVTPEGADYGWFITNEFKKDHNIELDFATWDGPLGNNLTVNGGNEAIVTIKAGETVSEPVELYFIRQGIRTTNSYLFPIQATDASTGEVYAELFYVVTGSDDARTVVGEKPSIFIGHVDTEAVNPNIATQFRLKIVKKEGRRKRTTVYNGNLFDIINLRTATVKEDNGKALLFLHDDITYVLKNRVQYVCPLQDAGIKVCLAIKGGGSGLGFSNMTDEQIADFALQAKVTVEMYGLDGVNLLDEGAGYDKEGAAPVSAASYAKLIKALKTAMPDKLLTLVDTRETTEALCDPVEGISVGDYVDYAWSSLQDNIAPYEPGYNYRPLSRMPEERYGTLNYSDASTWTDDFMFGMEENPMFVDLFMKERFTPLSGTKVLVYDNIPYYDYNREGMYWDMTFMYYQMLSMPVAEDGSFSYTWEIVKNEMVIRYYAFKKDW